MGAYNKVKSFNFLIAIALVLLSSKALADNYETFDIPRPKEGDLVCRAMVDEFSRVFSSYRLCNNNCQEMILPESFCRRGMALDRSWGPGKKMRVASIGDYFILLDDSNDIRGKILDAENSIEVCNARAFDKNGKVTSLRRLDSSLCYPGSEIIYWDGRNSHHVLVEVVLDTYLIADSEIGLAAAVPAQNDNQGPKNFIPASYKSIGIEL